ncbi:MAG: WD40/YVTN/BNR-like repeat-containing protein [Sulfobacillus sp.]
MRSLIAARATLVVALMLTVVACGSTPGHPTPAVHKPTASSGSGGRNTPSSAPATLPLGTGSAITVTPPLSSFPAQLTTVDFLTADVGWVAGSGTLDNIPQATILFTANGGSTWSSVSRAHQMVLALHFSTPLLGWVAVETGCPANGACQRSAIQRTTDGGKTWSTVYTTAGMPAASSPPEWTHFRFFSFGGQTYALAFGNLLVSANGGLTWKAISLPGTYLPADASFTSAPDGWVVASLACASTQSCPLKIFRTTNGGASWTAVTNLGSFGRQAAMGSTLFFVNSQDGWVVTQHSGYNGLVRYTTDGGASWQQEPVGLTTQNAQLGLLTFTSPAVGWLPVAGGAMPSASGLDVTTDGGRTWTMVGQTSDRPWSMVAASLVNPSTGYAVGDTYPLADPPFVVKTTDGGASWQQVWPAPAPVRDVSFYTAFAGFGLGLPSDARVLLHTTNGGGSWSRVGTVPPQPVAISFTSATHGYVSTLTSGVLVTTDGGRQWTQVANLGSAPSPTAFLAAFPTGQVFAQLTSSPTVVVQELGRTAIPQSFSWPRPGTAMHILSFPTPSYGFYGQWDVPGQTGGTLYATANGGATWHPVTTWGAETLYALAFSSPEDGKVLLGTYGGPGTLFSTTTGGRAWTRVGTISAGSANLFGTSLRMQFMTANDGWILTGSGLLRTTDGGASWTALP